ncbi:hypothetical protein KY342_04485 [Candidatus Woesearchaeota archaeon]|nr:hypothetical protein [Candidatus Woesearchaeota archaeon]
MSDIQQKLEDYLNDRDSTEYYPDEDVSMMDRMVEFIMNLNTDTLSDDQIEEAADIIDELADENLDDALGDVDEAITARKVKIKPSDKRKRRMEYRRNRASLKLKSKKFRRTTKYKQWKRAKKRKAGQGKTARGKRIRKFM